MTDMKDYVIPEPQFEKLFRMESVLRDVYPLGEIGTGYSEITAISGGKASGVVNGEILDFGGDWGLLHSGDVNILNAKYLIKTCDGAFISVSSKGRLLMGMEEMEQGETEGAPDPSSYYFRSSIEFSTGAEQYQWLNTIVAFAMMIITDEGNVCLDVYKLT